ncbi:response regulator [Salinicoccus roseus]|uniref:response regulator n=1 Tax=Salinicoccus roseus TaxID=45670 RepID=UPI00352585C8
MDRSFRLFIDCQFENSLPQSKEMDGLEVCRTIQLDDRRVPILMLTGRGESYGIIHGLDIGADDYVVKPFDPNELIARMKSVLRRSVHAAGVEEIIEMANMTIIPDAHRLVINGVELFMPSREMALLHFFATWPDQVLSRQQLLVVKKGAGRITDADRKFATELLEEVGLGDKLKKYPSQLSGGERQHTAIARAFINDPNIILADESTASLDSSRAFEIVELILEEAKKRNKAAVMVTHDERMLKYCDRVYEMSDGVLKEMEQTV